MIIRTKADQKLWIIINCIRITKISKPHYFTAGQHMDFQTQICLLCWSNFKGNQMTFVVIEDWLQVNTFKGSHSFCKKTNIFHSNQMNLIPSFIMFPKGQTIKLSQWRYHQGYGIITTRLLHRHQEVMLDLQMFLLLWLKFI